MSSPTFIAHAESAWTGNTTPRSAPGISVNAGDLIIVVGGDAGWTSTEDATPSSSGVAVTFSTIYDFGQSSYGRTWAFYGTAASTGTLTVSVDYNPSAWTYGFSVTQWRNAAIGNNGTAYTTSGSPYCNFSFTTGTNGSAVLFYCNDWDASGGTPTYETGFTQTFHQLDTSDGYGSFSAYNADIGNAGAYTVGSVNFSTNNGSLGAIEVVYDAGIVVPGVSYMGAFSSVGSLPKIPRIL